MPILPSSVPVSATPILPPPTPAPSAPKPPMQLETALSLPAKRTLLVEGVCAWARVDGFPWWPTVLLRRASLEPTLAPEDSLPPETPDNRLVEFFNDNNRVAVVHLTDLQEYTSAMNRLEEAGADFPAVLAACLEADEYIRNSGVTFQRESIGTVGSKKARRRKIRYKTLKDRPPTLTLASASLPSSGGPPSAQDHSQQPSPPWAVPLQVPPESPKEDEANDALEPNDDTEPASVAVAAVTTTASASPKDAGAEDITATDSGAPKAPSVKDTTTKSAASKMTSRKSAVSKEELEGSTAGSKTTAQRTSTRRRRPAPRAAAAATDTVPPLSGRRTRTKRSNSLPSAKRPRLGDSPDNRNSDSDRAPPPPTPAPASPAASSPGSTRLTLHISRAGSRSKSDERPPARAKVNDVPPRRLASAQPATDLPPRCARDSPPPGMSRRRGSDVGCTGMGRAEEWAVVGAAEETMVKMQEFTDRLERFVGRQRKVEEEYERMQKEKRALEMENKELQDMNELLKTVNEQQQNLAQHCQKASEGLRKTIARQRVESDQLKGCIAEQRKMQEGLQRWYDEMHDSCAELRKERRELRMEVQALQAKVEPEEKLGR